MFDHTYSLLLFPAVSLNFQFHQTAPSSLFLSLLSLTSFLLLLSQFAFLQSFHFHLGHCHSFDVSDSASLCMSSALCTFYLSVSLTLVIVPSLTARLSEPPRSFCLSRYLNPPLLQSGCWDFSPELPALGPRPLYFLNPRQLVSLRKAGCRENRKEVDPRGASLPFLLLGQGEMGQQKIFWEKCQTGNQHCWRRRRVPGE